MEIKTGRLKKESGAPEVPVPPDRSAAHKKPGQKLQPSRRLSGRLWWCLKVLGILATLGCVAFAGVSAWRYAYFSDQLALRQVAIVGCRNTSAAKLEAIVRQGNPANLLRIDLAALRNRLEQEPWVRKAIIRRVLPGTLRILIEERVPAVIAEIGGELELLDREGVLLDQYASGYGKLDVPVFRGLCGNNAAEYTALQAENSARVARGVQLLAEIESGSAELARAISEIDLANPENARVLLIDDTAVVSLGDRDFLKRFQAFLADYDGMKARYGEIISVDLRFYPQIVYRPRQLPGESLEKGPGGNSRPQ